MSLADDATFASCEQAARHCLRTLLASRRRRAAARGVQGPARPTPEASSMRGVPIRDTFSHSHARGAARYGQDTTGAATPVPLRGSQLRSPRRAPVTDTIRDQGGSTVQSAHDSRSTVAAPNRHRSKRCGAGSALRQPGEQRLHRGGGFGTGRGVGLDGIDGVDRHASGIGCFLGAQFCSVPRGEQLLAEGRLR